MNLKSVKSGISSGPSQGLGGSLPAATELSELGRQLENMRRTFLAVNPETVYQVHAVLGNESGDQDSVASSIAQAVFLQQIYPEPIVCVPVLNISKDELFLRKDLVAVLNLAGIDHKDLIFMEDTGIFEVLIQEHKLFLYLVDHNRLAIGQEYLAEAVVEVDDHHAVEEVSYSNLNKESTNIKTCASTASLIASKIIKSDKAILSPELASLLLSAILMDTNNLRPGGPATKVDWDSAERLSNIRNSFATKQTYERLCELKVDVSGFSYTQILLKDFKRYKQGEVIYAISSLPPTISLEDAGSDAFEMELAGLCKSKNASFHIALMSGGLESSHKRTIKIYADDLSRLERIYTNLKQHETAGSGLSRGESKNPNIMTLYSTNALPRKRFQPILQSIGL